MNAKKTAKDPERFVVFIQLPDAGESANPFVFPL